jgi:hypothetical protein
MPKIFYNHFWNTFKYWDNTIGIQAGTLRHLNYKRSTHWPAIRRAHLREHKTCAACGTKFNLEVHHIIPYQLNPALELEPTNLITLCDNEDSGIRCHLYFGHLGDFNQYNPAVEYDAAYNLLHPKKTI